MMSIRVNGIVELLEVVEGLVKKGLTFEATSDGGSFIIKLTGGF